LLLYFRRASNTAWQTSSNDGICPDACSRAISASICASSFGVGLFTGHNQSVILQTKQDGPNAAVVYHDSVSEGETVRREVVFDPEEGSRGERTEEKYGRVIFAGKVGRWCG
jgi:hypothetical protein